MVKTVLLCPGQGAQHVGMGKDLAEESTVARSVFEQIDDHIDEERAGDEHPRDITGERHLSLHE